MPAMGKFAVNFNQKSHYVLKMLLRISAITRICTYKLMSQFAEDHPRVAKLHMSKDVDPTPIDHEIQDLKRTEYLIKYCSRGK